MEKKSMKQRVVALISAGALAASMAAMPALAFADNSASAGSQVGTGTTALNMITADDGSEHDESSVNLAFTFPSAINYVVAANGHLTGPTAVKGANPVAVIDNDSNFQIHVSSADVDNYGTWNIVADSEYASATTANTVKLSIGPSGNQIDAGSYMNKESNTDNLPAAKQWQMESNGAANNADQTALDSSGDAKNITNNITSDTKFGTINWYVKAGPKPTV